jgi:hypothetical protein
MICPICEKEILDEKKFMIASDRPYFNVYVHIDCKENILSGNNNTLEEIKNKLYNYFLITINKGIKTRKNK